MANFQRSHLFQSFTATVSPPAAVNYPASLVGDREFPHLPWRSTSTAPQTLLLDFGSVVSIAGIALFHCNFATVALAHGATVGGSFSSLTGSPFTTAPEPPAAPLYRRAVMVPFTNRVLQLVIPSQTPVNGASFFSLGLIVCLSVVTTFQENPEPGIQFTYTVPVFEQPIGAHVERVAAGPPSIGMEIGGQWLNSDSQNMVDIKALLTLGPHTPFVLFRNRGNPAEVYFFRAETGRWTENFPASTGTVSFKEVV